MVRKFQPEEYHDAYREALKGIIEAKVRGEEVKVMEMPSLEEIPDLMSALKASIEAATKESATQPKARSAASPKKSAR
jgi:DNA end-binding protein Ku